MVDAPGPRLHPALDGREPQLESLAAEVRRLVALTVTTAAPPELLAEVTAELGLQAARLEAELPQESFPRFVGRDPRAPAEGPDIEKAMPFDVVVGRYNPLALPVKLEIDPPRAIGRGVFTTPYEGAPGCVHGASIAGAFDIVLTAANMLEGAAGPTVRLALRFRRPTLLNQEAYFEGWVRERTERRVHTSGRLVQNGQVAVEAEGEFASLDMGQIASLHKR
jgi:acyl-coenzyme A thioesterase PaaI-like protein